MVDIPYSIFKVYVKLMHDSLLYRKRYIIGMENLPKTDERYFIACNHENTGNDPINIVMGLPYGVKMSAMARADLFKVHPIMTSFIRWIGLVPAYRAGWEGPDGLVNNMASFGEVAKRVNECSPLLICPQAGHTQGHYSERFTTGLARIGFITAEQNGWKEDVKLLPTALVYSDYFDVQTELMWIIRPAISLKPYYEEFQHHKPTVMRKVTRQLFDSIQQAMLDEGLQDYEVRDFLRLTTLNLPDRESMPLPQQLEHDKQFIARLTSHPHYDEIITLASELRQRLQEAGTSEPVVASHPSLAAVTAKALLMLVLAPLWLVCLWPHGLCYSLPLLLLKTDKMFTNTYRLAISVLFLYPLLALVTLLVMGLTWGLWWQAVVWILLWIPTGKLGWLYFKHLRTLKAQVNCLRHRGMMPRIEELRSRLAELLK